MPLNLHTPYQEYCSVCLMPGSSFVAVVPQDNVVEDFITVDPKHHRYFVARRGQVLRDLADEYGGVMVSFPRTTLAERQGHPEGRQGVRGGRQETHGGNC